MGKGTAHAEARADVSQLSKQFGLQAAVAVEADLPAATEPAEATATELTTTELTTTELSESATTELAEATTELAAAELSESATELAAAELSEATAAELTPTELSESATELAAAELSESAATELTTTELAEATATELAAAELSTATEDAATAEPSGTASSEDGNRLDPDGVEAHPAAAAEAADPAGSTDPTNSADASNPSDAADSPNSADTSDSSQLASELSAKLAELPDLATQLTAQLPTELATQLPTELATQLTAELATQLPTELATAELATAELPEAHEGAGSQGRDRTVTSEAAGLCPQGAGGELGSGPVGRHRHDRNHAENGSRHTEEPSQLPEHSTTLIRRGRRYLGGQDGRPTVKQTPWERQSRRVLIRSSQTAAILDSLADPTCAVNCEHFPV